MREFKNDDIEITVKPLGELWSADRVFKKGFRRATWDHQTYESLAGAMEQAFDWVVEYINEKHEAENYGRRMRSGR